MPLQNPDFLLYKPEAHTYYGVANAYSEIYAHSMQTVINFGRSSEKCAHFSHGLGNYTTRTCVTCGEIIECYSYLGAFKISLTLAS